MVRTSDRGGAFPLGPDIDLRHTAENLARRGDDLLFVREEDPDLRLPEVRRARAVLPAAPYEAARARGTEGRGGAGVPGERDSPSSADERCVAPELDAPRPRRVDGSRPPSRGAARSARVRGTDGRAGAGIPASAAEVNRSPSTAGGRCDGWWLNELRSVCHVDDAPACAFRGRGARARPRRPSGGAARWRAGSRHG